MNAAWPGVALSMSGCFYFCKLHDVKVLVGIGEWAAFEVHAELFLHPFDLVGLKPQNLSFVSQQKGERQGWLELDVDANVHRCVVSVIPKHPVISGHECVAIIDMQRCGCADAHAVVVRFRCLKGPWVRRHI